MKLRLAGLLPGLALAALATLQLANVHNPDIIEVDAEELWNAGQAWWMLECGLSDTFALQYREFCGGCSLNALLGTALFSVLPRSWLAWKLIPLFFLLLLAITGSQALRRISGAPAAWAFLGLLLLPPRTWLFISGLAWGNHYEAGCLALAGFCLLLGTKGRGATLLGGLVVGSATFTGFSGLFAIPAVLLWIHLSGQRNRLPQLLQGIALGLSPWLLQWWTAGSHPFVTIYQGGEGWPSLNRVPYKLQTLLAPRQLVALFGHPDSLLGWWLGWLWGTSAAAALLLLGLWAARGDRTTSIPSAALGGLLLTGSWIAMYSLVRFQLHDPPAPQVAYPLSLRYAAPLYPLLLFALALGAGELWRQQARVLAASLLIVPLMAGATTRAESLSGLSLESPIFRFEAVDWEFIRASTATRLGTESLNSCRSEEQRSRELRAYIAGRNGASRILHQRGVLNGFNTSSSYPAPYWTGVGEAIARHLEESLRKQPEVLQPLNLIELSAAELSKVHALPPAGEQAALRGAAQLYLAHSINWQQVQGGWDGGALARRTSELRRHSQPVASAAWWVLGLDCGRSLSQFHRPRSIVLPRAVQDFPEPFFEGLGTALGERWGPLSALPRPDRLPLAGGRALRQGYAKGVAKRWLGALPDELPELALPP